MGVQARSLQEAFWAFVEKQEGEGCWLWVGPLSGGGPQVCYQGKILRAAKLSFEVHGGIVPEGSWVRVNCGNKLCVNPAHLRAGVMTPGALAAQALKRFWANIQKTDTCWLWTGETDCNARQAFRYGRLRDGSRDKSMPAHRYYYEIHKGPIPEGQFICHRCAVPLCVRPEHLFVGTHQDNMNDMVSKERIQRGTQHRRTTLTEENVRRMRALWAQKAASQKELARMFEVGLSNVKHVLARRSWGHVE